MEQQQKVPLSLGLYTLQPGAVLTPKNSAMGALLIVLHQHRIIFNCNAISVFIDLRGW